MAGAKKYLILVWLFVAFSAQQTFAWQASNSQAPASNISAPTAAAPTPSAKTEATKPETKAKEVVVGMYVNDIQTVDLRTNAYAVDLYLWFRWKDPAMRPITSFEFMNRFDPDNHVQSLLYEKPVPQPDGSFYQIVRHQGQFTNKFPLKNYPFDSQTLLISLEDAQQGSLTQQYVPDHEAIKLNPEIRLPGYEIGKPFLEIRDKAYPTIFGDLSNLQIGAYSRAEFKVPITRPVVSGLFKALIPVFLIILCAVLALILDPAHVEARIGLSITALLTLVAMQFTLLSNFPDVSYLTLLDQIYLLSYFYILLVIGFIVMSTRLDDRGALKGKPGMAARLAQSGPLLAKVTAIGYAALVIVLCVFNLV